MPNSVLRFLLASLALFACGSTLRAAEVSPADQSAIQAVLKRVLIAMNACNLPEARTDLTPDFRSSFFGGGPPACRPGAQNTEIAALGRSVRAATPDVVTGMGYFRTQNKPPLLAGRLFFTFVRQAAAWKLSELNFIPMPFEKPYVAVEINQKQSPAASDGWLHLFDGSSTDHFLNASGAPFPASWKLDDGALRAIAPSSPSSPRHGLRTSDTFRSFELRWSWKSPAKGNSGIKYRLFYLTSFGENVSDASGNEYQLADDDGDPGAKQHPVERSGSLYNQMAPQGAVPKPIGEWNDSAIIVRGRHCEHWLNGVKVVEFDTESDALEGPIVFQHHGTDMWFRDIRIRRLD